MNFLRKGHPLDKRNSKLSPACSDLKHKIGNESLCDNTYRVHEELRSPAHSELKHTVFDESLCDNPYRVHEEFRSPAYSLKPKILNESLCNNPCWVREELPRRGEGKVGELENDIAFLRNDLEAEGTAFAELLRTCARKKDLCKGNRVHAHLLKKGLLEKSSHVVHALINMYAKCGALLKAKKLLHGIPSRHIACWNALITAYTQQGQGQNALNLFEWMRLHGLSPNEVTFSCILKACGSLRTVDRGVQIHDQISKQGLLGNNIVLGNALVDMYAKCGALEKALDVLEELPARNVVSWTALISGYAQQGKGRDALNCYERMKREGLFPNVVTFTCVLKACGSIGATTEGRRVHDEVVKQGLLGKDIVLANALVDMYAKCGALGKAREVLEELPIRDVVSWNALIAGYAQHGEGEEALHCFIWMQEEGFSPNAVTFASVLKACGSTRAIDKGVQIHDEIAKQGLLGKNIVLGTALVDMYIKCGALAKARRVLEDLPARDVVSWTALIEGYAQQGDGEEALNCLTRMRHDGLSPNAVTYASILRACGSIGAVDRGEQFHDEIAKQGMLKNNVVLGTTLVDMYSRCGALAKARRVLDELPTRNAISWTALIEGYAQQGQGEEALNCYKQMQRDGFPPDALTFVCVLRACGNMGAADRGEEIHDKIARQGLLENNIVVGTALVDMYAKCGALAKAQELLEGLTACDVVSWNTLIAGYAQQGQNREALKCFEQMRRKGLSPDAYTLRCILNACNHSGLVDEGQMYFANMSTKYGIEPDLEHYTCMVDLFGRAGHLDRAVAIIQKMPSYDYCVVWHALLGACWKWRDVNVGRWAFEHAVQVDRCDVTAYVLMANIYAAAGMQEDADNVEVIRVENQACM